MEQLIFDLTRPINGQYPRPWLTGSDDPGSARVYTIGRNQRRGFPQADVDAIVGGHRGYMDTLFNRGEIDSRQLYDRIAGAPSPTRKNTDRLVELLRREGVADVLETNVICYSTPMSADLNSSEHAGGRQRGTAIFRSIYAAIRPRVLIVHGAGTVKDLSRVLNQALPEPPSTPGRTVRAGTDDGVGIWIIPSLAPPAFNRWQSWSQEHLEQVAAEVAAFLDQK